MSIEKQSRIIHPGRFKSGVVHPPTDRSISHRTALLAGISSGTSTIRGFRQTDECLNTLSAMEALGARSRFDADGVLTIQGTGGRMLEPAGPLDVGISLTAMRLLAGLCAGAPITTTLSGNEVLNHHLMDRIQEPLRLMGADVQLTPARTAPMVIRGGGLKGISYSPPFGGAQVKSCCILAGLYAEGVTTVVEPVPTRDHTERLIAALGAPLVVDGPRISLQGYGPSGPKFKARDYVVPGNFSGAAYWLVAAAATPGLSIRAENVGLNPRRTALLSVLGRMGADVQVETTSPPDAPERYGSVTVTGPDSLLSTTVAGDEIHNLIDELPLVAFLGSRARGTTTIRDVHREIGMMHAILDNFTQLGIPVTPQADGFVVEGPAPISPAHAAVKSYEDARVAMAMAVLAAFADRPILVGNVACVDDYYPEFWNQLTELGVTVE